jgi:hypothetical protein
MLGEEVAELVNSFQIAGSHELKLDATGLPSGVYIYKIETNNFVASRKIMLIR